MKVVIAPNPALRAKTKPVQKITPALIQTIKQMIKLTKTFVEPEGVGLASTQVGLNEQFFISKMQDKTFRAFFNPKILSASKKTKLMFEGCLSIPLYWGQVKRHTWIQVSYINENGHEVKEKLIGLMAHIFQHEADHLHGKLFMDHILAEKTKLFKVVGKDRTGSEIFEEVGL